MKSLILGFSLSLFTTFSFSQTVGIGTETPNPQAALDIKATGIQGILIPRLQGSDTTGFKLSTNDKGMLFYDTISTNIMVWTGNKWKSYQSVGNSSPSLNTWNIDGNATSLQELTLGTTTNTHLNIKTNNTNALTIGNNGRVAIGNLNNYNQLTSDLVIRRKETATNGTKGVFVDIINENVNTPNSLNGIRFSNYPTSLTNQHTSGAIFFQGDGGNGGNGKIIFASKNGPGTVNVNDGRMSIDKLGHVGIGTISTTHRLEVVEPIGGIKLILSENHPVQYGTNLSTKDNGRIALTLEDGAFRQALVLGDFSSGDNSKNYFGISQSKNGGTNWTPDFVVSYDGNIGIANPTPQASLDINGNLATTPFIHNTVIPNLFILNHQKKSIIIINKQLTDFRIEGILPAPNGTRLTIINMTDKKMTIVDKSTIAITNNRIETLKNGADFSTNMKGSIDLIYSTEFKMWISTGSNN